MTKSKAKAQIRIVLDGFDFTDVHLAMTALKRKWKFENGLRVPSYQELEHNAKLILEKVADSKDDVASFSIGGFEATKQDNILQLRFILVSSNPLNALLNS